MRRITRCRFAHSPEQGAGPYVWTRHSSFVMSPLVHVRNIPRSTLFRLKMAAAAEEKTVKRWY